VLHLRVGVRSASPRFHQVPVHVPCADRTKTAERTARIQASLCGRPARIAKPAPQMGGARSPGARVCVHLFIGSFGAVESLGALGRPVFNVPFVLAAPCGLAIQAPAPMLLGVGWDLPTSRPLAVPAIQLPSLTSMVPFNDDVIGRSSQRRQKDTGRVACRPRRHCRARTPLDLAHTRPRPPHRPLHLAPRHLGSGDRRVHACRGTSGIRDMGGGGGGGKVSECRI